MAIPRRNLVRGSLALAFAAAFAAFLFRPSLRSPAFDDSDLTPDSLGAPRNASNAVWLLERAALAWTVDEAVIRQWREQLSATSALPAETRAFLATVTNLDAILRSADAAPFARLVPVRDYFDEQPEFAPWQPLDDLAALRIRASLDDERFAEAVEVTLRAVHLGRRLEGAGDSLIESLRGRRFADIAVAQLVQHADRFGPRDPALLLAIRGLLDGGSNRDGLSNVVKREHRRALAAFGAIKRGRFPGASNSLTIPLPNLFLDLNQVRRREAAVARFTLRHLHSPLIEIPFEELQHWHSPTSLVRSLLRGNAIGSALLDLDVDAFRRLLQSAASADARARLAATLLALRAHESRGHGLPTHLSELVPEFLPAVPLDPFDHRPLRFDRTRRILWSIGRDLVDDQGRKRSRRDRDATFDEVVAIPWPP